MESAMRLIYHGFNLYAVIVLGGFGVFGLALAAATVQYRRWLRRNDPQRR
jgi:hypothetical protein